MIRPSPFPEPACARLGNLEPARLAWTAGDLAGAWQAVGSAIGERPFHPEAVRLAVEIARAGGRDDLARRGRLWLGRWAPGMASAVDAGESAATCSASGSDGWRLPEEVEALLDGREPRLTACLIVRDEERFLPGCLDSIRGLAAQVVVVDTGSTDGTRDIARARGAEVLEFRWIDDFAAARNRGLERARGDWVLILDADEELPPDRHGALRRLLRAEGVLSWRLPIEDVGREADGCSYVPRLFRNAPGAHFVGRVHEEAFGSLEGARRAWGLESRSGDAILRHHGYTAEVTKARDKVARNLALLERAIAEHPGHPVLLMNLGLELARSGRGDESLGRYREAFAAMCRRPPSEATPEMREALLDQFTTRLIAGRRWTEVVEVLESPWARAGTWSAGLHFARGLADRELGRFADAATRFRACLARREERSWAPSSALIRGVAPRHLLARSLWEAGDRDASDREFRRALEEDPRATAVTMDYARFLRATGRMVEALQWLHRSIAQHPDDVAPWRLGAAIALERPEFLEVARDWTEEACARFPDDVKVLESRGEVLLLSERLHEAWLVWRMLGDGPNARAARVLCAVVIGEFPEPLPAGSLPEVARAYLGWVRRLLAFGAVTTLCRIGATADRLRTVLPRAAEIVREILDEASGPVADAGHGEVVFQQDVQQSGS